MTRQCSMTGCERPHVARGLCSRHWTRWRNHGDPSVVLVASYEPGSSCSVERCDRPVNARGWCKRHYEQWRIYGDPLSYTGIGVDRSENPTYSAIHTRLKARRGPASSHACVDCGRTAAEWSYDGSDRHALHEARHGRRLAYSIDLDRYVPRCVSCHRTHDHAATVAA